MNNIKNIIKNNKSQKKILQGIVKSNKMIKTAVVEINRLIKHKLYKKRIKVSSKIFVHDKKNECKIGDLVLIKMCRPISKKKSFILVSILNNKS